MIIAHISSLSWRSTGFHAIHNIHRFPQAAMDFGWVMWLIFQNHHGSLNKIRSRIYWALSENLIFNFIQSNHILPTRDRYIYVNNIKRTN